ncbi:hypothetical protein BD414DRAFT_476772 [Trametes punicea]|nr:hypothetical protein BD414DRAFT_476772 [Trametes punicea]
MISWYPDGDQSMPMVRRPRMSHFPPGATSTMSTPTILRRVRPYRIFFISCACAEDQQWSNICESGELCW